MAKQKIRVKPLVMLVLAFSLLVVPASGQPNIGEPAPAFTLRDLAGKAISFPEDFKGKAVLLNFWATWCPPCRREIPALNRFYDVYGDAAVVLGINLLEDIETVRGFAEEFKIVYPILLDSYGAVGRLYQITAIPTSFFIDPQGSLRETIVGELRFWQIESTVAEKVFKSDLIPLGLPVAVTHALDLNQDGKPEAELLDADGDGIPEGGRVDINSDGTHEATALIFKKVARGLVPIKTVQLKQVWGIAGELVIQRLAVDINQNGNPEILIIDDNLDGRSDRVLLDVDDDGRPDLSFP